MKDCKTKIIYNRFSGFVAYQETDKGIKIIYKEKHSYDNIGGIQ